MLVTGGNVSAAHGDGAGDGDGNSPLVALGADVALNGDQGGLGQQLLDVEHFFPTLSALFAATAAFAATTTTSRSSRTSRHRRCFGQEEDGDDEVEDKMETT